MKFKPHQYQLDAIKFILTQNKSLLFLDMGMGKTVITLTAISFLLERKLINKVLVVAPKAVAENVWSAEGLKWAHTEHIPIEVCVGKHWSNAETSRAQVVVVNKDNVAKLNLDHFDMLVIDEVTCIKDPSTKLFKHLKRGVFNYFVGLTGTPLTTGLKHIWSLMFMVDRGVRLGRTYYEFISRYFYKINQYKLELRKEAMGTITRLIKDKVLVLSAKGNLPPNEIVYINCEVDFNPRGRRLHDDVVKHLVLFDKFDRPVKIVPNIAVSLNYALQICNGAYYKSRSVQFKEPINPTYDVIHTSKFDALKEILETCNDNVLIAYQFKFDLDMLKFGLLSLSEEYTSDNVRSIYTHQDVADWNARKIKIGLCQPKSLGKGVNLQHGGSIIIWFGLTWSLEDYDQFNARLARQGQTMPVRVINLMIRNSIEQVVLKRLHYNRNNQSEFKTLLK